MKSLRVALTLVVLGAVAFVTWSSVPVGAQAPTIKIGVLYDHTGPFAAGGSLNCWRGAKMMIDYVNEKGGVLGKYKIVQVDGDGQSKTEVAINEATRLLDQENVNLLMGVFSSAHCVPMAQKADAAKKFMFVMLGPTVGAVFTLMLAEGLRLALGEHFKSFPALDLALYGLMLVLFIIYMLLTFFSSAVSASCTPPRLALTLAGWSRASSGTLSKPCQLKNEAARNLIASWFHSVCA